MRLKAVLLVCALIAPASPAIAADWQYVIDGKDHKLYFDRSGKLVGGRNFQTQVREHYSESQSSPSGHQYNERIVAVSLDCTDLSSTFTRRTEYLNGVQKFDEKIDRKMPPVPDTTKGWAAVYKAACARR